MRGKGPEGSLAAPSCLPRTQAGGIVWLARYWDRAEFKIWAGQVGRGAAWKGSSK